MKKWIHVGVFVVLLAVLLAWYFSDGRPAVTGLFRNGSYGTQMELDSSFSYAAGKYNGGVAVCGKNSIVGINNGGRKAWEVEFSATVPILSCNGRYVLAAEQGGRKLLLLSGGRVRYEMETREEIITASVNSKGVFAVVSEERGYKGCVRVYNSKGNELYAWHSAEQNILTAAVSEDSKKLAVSVANMTDLSRVCTVLQFDMDETTPRMLTVGDENLTANLVYNGTELTAIGDEALYYFKSDGTEKFRLDYAGRELQKYSFYSGGVLCLCFKGGQSGGASSVEFYDSNGKMKGSCMVDEAVSALDTFGTYAVVTTQSGFLIVSQNGAVRARRDEGISAERIFMCGGRNRLFLLSGISAGMYIF